MSHTPGPWESGAAGPTMKGYSQPFGIYSVENFTMICGVFGDVRGGVDVARDNAKLIAASPELLEALEAALPYIEQAYECAFPDSITNIIVLEQARAAIKKARGK